jgi:predicted kinase
MNTVTNKLYVLVGVPGSGKSTWVQNQDWAQECVYISTDQYVEDWAKEQGKTYSDVFDEYMPEAVAKMAIAVVDARDAGKDIIWDQTSTTVKSRERKFRMLPDYYAIAVVFPTPEREELNQRLASRVGKHVPDNVVDSMIDNWQEPTEEEGFKEIWRT